MKGLRVLELADALNVESSDLLAICAILNLKATSRISTLSFQDCKKITDYYEEIKSKWIIKDNLILFNIFNHWN